MSRLFERTALAAALALALAGCNSNETRPEAPQPEAASASQPVATAAPAAPAAPAPAAATPCQDSKSAIAKDKGSKSAKDKNGKEKASSKSAKGKSAPAKADAVACPEDAPPPAQPAAAEAPKPQAAPAKDGAYNLSKNKPVTDSTKVEAGQGTKVKGINDWEGEITGVPAANSKFTKLKIGMSLQQAIDLVGTPTDQGAYVTGKAFIPFYFGSDKTRWEAVYKGQGRLIFANQAGFGTGQYLVWVIHNSSEPGYR